MSILLSVNPPFAGWLVDGEKTIEWRKKPLPARKAYIYETKKNGGCGMAIGEVEIQGIYNVSAITLPKAWVKFGKVSRAKLQTYSKGKPFYGNSCFEPKRYDKPLPLSEFRVRKKIRGYHKQGENFAERLLHGGRIEVRKITRPPQSWCYCEDLQKSKEETDTTVEKKEIQYAQNCGTCAFFDGKNFMCRIDRETKNDPAHNVCCDYSKHPGKMKNKRSADQDIRCANCAWYVREKGRCWCNVMQKCNDDTVCGLGRKRSDYE